MEYGQVSSVSASLLSKINTENIFGLRSSGIPHQTRSADDASFIRNADGRHLHGIKPPDTSSLKMSTYVERRFANYIIAFVKVFRMK